MDDAGVLTTRELEVLSLTCSGHNAQEIADRLRIARCTVENHKRRIYRKLGVTSQGQAVSRGIALNLLDGRPSPPRRPARPGRELVVVHTRCLVAAEVVARTLIACGRALVIVTDRLAGEDVAGWDGVLRFTAVLIDPAPADWLLPVRLGARTVAVPSEPPGQTAVADAVARGAYAVLCLEDVPDHLCAVLDLVSSEYVVAGAEMFRRRAPEPRLTPREREVLVSIALGRTIRQTARMLGIAGKTVESTRARLFWKLGARNRAEALVNAYRAGLLPEEPPTDLDWPDQPGRTSADPPF
ncbi:MAG TPA: LuxR C-terminal-related transcriptional regulator [Nonomuraea sp.]|nr:LuxR C-terminal-related transcriptional regulator [Nonomuraea sp.]